MIKNTNVIPAQTIELDQHAGLSLIGKNLWLFYDRDPKSHNTIYRQVSSDLVEKLISNKSIITRRNKDE